MLIISGICAGLVLAGAQSDTIRLTPLPTGASMKLGGYMPIRLQLSTERPADLKNAPPLAAPMYGALKLGPKGSEKSFLVVVDEPAGGPGKLYVDSNGNGDLTDDPAPVWNARPYQGADGSFNQHTGSAQVMLDFGGKVQPIGIGMYRFDPKDPQRAALKEMLLYYRDYGYEGEVTVGGEKYRAMLSDDAATGDFRGAEGQNSGVRLLIDRNRDGKFDGRSETFDVRKPFNIGGTTYEVANMSPSGGSFQLARSTQVVAEILPPPDLRIGKRIPSFKAQATDGSAVDFPSSYKGKVVLLDFWAIWCGPCIAELPHVTEAYAKYSGQGFEILGISLDQPNMAEKLAQFTKERNMPWKQIYEGKYWDVSLVKDFGVQGIPFVLLIDGDTGEILADASTLRGPQLLKTIESSLAKKFGR
jgi:thiol-disulfide isomerase/thioredoxin